MIEIDFDDKQVQASLRRYRENLTESAGMMRRISFALRDYVRETMSGGRKRPHAPLSMMTSLRTGRRKPFTTIRQFVKSSYTATDVKVFFETPNGEDWTIQQHHKGYTIPARVGRQGFMTSRTSNPKFFMTAKAVRVPAREIIPTRAEVDSVVSREIREWIHNRRGL